MRPAEEIVVKHRRKYLTHWRTKSNLYWFVCLVEEVFELGFALLRLHRHSPNHELRGIASVCINWIEYRYEKKDEIGKILD